VALTLPAATKPYRESTRRIAHFLPLREATGVAVDKDKRTARVIIITEGLGNLRDRNFYTDSAVKSCVEIFNGRQFYIDHPSAHEEDDRPERSIRDLAGYFFDTQMGTSRDPDTNEELAACYASLRFDESASGQFALDKVATALEYQSRFPNSKDVYAGISINGGGVSHPGTIKGMSVNVVTEIQEAFSADIVTKPARGGRFLALMQEAARAAEWKRKTARESRTPSRTSGEKRGRVMAVVTSNKESKSKKGKGPVMQESVRLSLLAALAGVKEAARDGKPKRTLNLFTEAVKLFKERGIRTNEEEIRGLMRKMRAALDDGNDPATILKDVQTDLGALGKAIAGGGGKPEAEHDMAAEGEGEKEAEGENEKEAEGEQGEGEKEAEGESAETEAEGEQEAEGEAEGEHEAEGEDEQETEDAASENEGEEGYTDEGDGDLDDAGDDETTDDDAGEFGMGDDDEEGYADENENGQAMQYKCAKCGEVNQVMPPKGFKLAKMGESAKTLKRRLVTKETRFVKANERHARLVRENVRLRAENQGYKLLEQARKLLKDAGVSPKILSPRELVESFDPRQWPYEIKMALKTMESERVLLDKGGHGPRSNGGGATKNVAADDEARNAFRESYKKHSASGSTADDE